MSRDAATEPGPPGEHTITQVKPLERPRGYCAVYVDGDVALRAPAKIVAGLGFRAGRVMRADELRHAIATAQEEEALEAALKVLTACDRTEAELRRHLGRRGFRQPIIATVLDRLREKGLIDDHRYAREYVRTQGARRGLGPAALRAKLDQLGVASSLVDEALAEEMTEERQQQIAEAVAAGRWRSLRGTPGDAARSRIYVFLVRRGFDYDLAAEVSEGLPADE